MPHPSQMFYWNHSKFGKRSSSVQSLISRGCHCIWSGHRMSFNICEGEKFILFDKIPVSTIKLPQWRFQAFLDVSLFEKLIWKSRHPQDKTSIRGASPGISYKLRNKDAIGGRGWNIATQERKICDVEIEIVTFVNDNWRKNSVIKYLFLTVSSVQDMRNELQWEYTRLWFFL